MSSSLSCEELRALAPELALGIAAGDQRAQALEHLAGCTACRRHVEALSGLADDLLLLSPAEEPPAGFETRVLERMRPARRRRPLVVAAAAAVAGATLAAAAVWIGLADDRDLASQYREIFARADGTYFDVQPLEGPGGEEAGRVFGYQGRPSWVQIVVDAGRRSADGRYGVQVVNGTGERTHLRAVRVRGGTGSGGEAIPIDLDEVAEVRLIGPGMGNVLQAEFGAWSGG